MHALDLEDTAARLTTVASTAAQIAADMLAVPFAFVSLVDARRSVPVACRGSGSEVVARDRGLCALILQDGRPLVVADCATHPRLRASSPAVGEHRARFCAGLPFGLDGTVSGVLCVMDSQPRQLSAAQQRLLAQLVRLLEHQIETLQATRAVDVSPDIAEPRAASSAELEQFAHVASHDLQGPLGTISTHTQLLLRRVRGQLDAEADRHLQYIAYGTHKLQKLANSLLAFSHVDPRGQPLTVVSSREVVSAVLSSLQHLIDEAEATIYVAELPMVLADEGQLRQLLRNLLLNAIAFRGEAPPHIRIRAHPAGALQRFSVADNGVGFDMREAERIFRIFQGAHDRAKYAGTGVGLTVAKRIVERHGGTIWAESTPGAGSTFFFTLRAPPQIESSELASEGATAGGW